MSAMPVDLPDLSRDLRVLATFHKPYTYNADSLWLRPCTVGSFRMDAPGVHCDATGENISELNRSFCELTALYWAWKNLPEVAHLDHMRHEMREVFIAAPDVVDALGRCLNVDHPLRLEALSRGLQRLLGRCPQTLAAATRHQPQAGGGQETQGLASRQSIPGQ